MEEREVQKIALVVLSSNSGLCGSFNANIIRKATQVLECNKGKEVIIYPIGQKVGNAIRKLGYYTINDFEKLVDKPLYPQIVRFGETLIEAFLNKKVDRVELIYTHSKSLSSQEVREEVYLPLSLPFPSERYYDYILEPSAEGLLQTLLPKVLLSRIYSVILDSSLSEYSARTIAMQVATDNAEDLQQELSVQYNKNRQQAITSELLDMENGGK